MKATEIRRHPDEGGILNPRREEPLKIERCIQRITDQEELLTKLHLSDKRYSKIIVSDACKAFGIKETKVRMIMRGGMS